jgi:predicted permease
LVIAQVALCVALLIGAGLFIRSLHNVLLVRVGYDSDPVLMVDLMMRGEHLDSVQMVLLRRRLLGAATETPVVEHAAMQTGAPFMSTWSVPLHVDGIDSVDQHGEFPLNSVSPDYFATLGTRILHGRSFSDQDKVEAPQVMVVSDAMGKTLFPGKDPLGQCVRLGSSTAPCTFIVGIAENTRANVLASELGFYYYVPTAQWHPEIGGLFVRTRGRASQYVNAVRQRLQTEMPGASYVKVTPLSELLERQTSSFRLGATIFLGFGALALSLVGIGVYGVVSYSVIHRAHEFGVRAALGAQSQAIWGPVMFAAFRLAVVSVVIGSGVALAAAPWLAPLLFNQSPRDPTVFAFVAAVVTTTSLLASGIPAYRASIVDPVVALRAEQG